LSTFATALRDLESAQKSPKGVSVYARYVNRPMGRFFAALSFSLGLTPNQVTLVSAAVSLAGIALVALVAPTAVTGIVVAALLVIGFALDSADGQLARLRRSGSAAGEWLDHVVDCVKHVALHLAVLIAFYRYFELSSPAWYLVPMGFLLVALTTFVGGLLTEQLKRRTVSVAGGATRTTAPAARPSMLRAVALLPADYGTLCLVFVLLGDQGPFLAAYAGLFAVNAVLLVAFLAKWYRELARSA
jgi:phosphatidylglycerophosphate synthase